jgi:hypothetical protein
VTRPTGRQLVMGGAIVAVLAAVAAGLLVLESPAVMRERELDRRRTRDLYAITRGVDIYWENHHQLPASLDALRPNPGGPDALPETLDPVSEQAYEYRVIGSNRYELCATFDRESEPRVDNFWAHGPGRHCFTFDPEADLHYP